jgi:peroxiredoxin Q/BCP
MATSRNPNMVRLLFASAAAMALACAPARAQDKVDLKVGDAAPSFEGTDDQGKPWKSADHVGKKVVVVYFFPAAMTGG